MLDLQGKEEIFLFSNEDQCWDIESQGAGLTCSLEWVDEDTIRAYFNSHELSDLYFDVNGNLLNELYENLIYADQLYIYEYLEETGSLLRLLRE